MITGQWHIAPNATWRNDPHGGTWYPTASVIMQTVTDVEITNLSIPIMQFDPYEGLSFDVDIDVDGVRVFHETVLLTGALYEKIYYDVSPNVRVAAGSTLSISATVPTINFTLTEYAERTSVTLPWGLSSYSTVLEVIIDGSYAPIWTLDSQNDGYAYLISIDPTPFTEFAKDADGYPLNWGVWKLDDNNDRYPWPTGYVPIFIHNRILYVKDEIDGWKNTLPLINTEENNVKQWKTISHIVTFN